MNKFQRADGSTTTDPREILDMQAKLYETLYKSDTDKTREENIEYLRKTRQ
jgi:hypothetical protein